MPAGAFGGFAFQTATDQGQQETLDQQKENLERQIRELQFEVAPAQGIEPIGNQNLRDALGTQRLADFYNGGVIPDTIASPDDFVATTRQNIRAGSNVHGPEPTAQSELGATRTQLARVNRRLESEAEAVELAGVRRVQGLDSRLNSYVPPANGLEASGANIPLRRGADIMFDALNTQTQNSLANIDSITGGVDVIASQLGANGNPGAVDTFLENAADAGVDVDLETLQAQLAASDAPLNGAALAQASFMAALPALKAAAQRDIQDVHLAQTAQLQKKWEETGGKIAETTDASHSLWRSHVDRTDDAESQQIANFVSEVWAGGSDYLQVVDDLNAQVRGLDVFRIGGEEVDPETVLKTVREILGVDDFGVDSGLVAPSILGDRERRAIDAFQISPSVLPRGTDVENLEARRFLAEHVGNHNKDISQTISKAAARIVQEVSK